MGYGTFCCASKLDDLIYLLLAHRGELDEAGENRLRSDGVVNGLAFVAHVGDHLGDGDAGLRLAGRIRGGVGEQLGAAKISQDQAAIGTRL